MERQRQKGVVECAATSGQTTFALSTFCLTFYLVEKKRLIVHYLYSIPNLEYKVNGKLYLLLGIENMVNSQLIIEYKVNSAVFIRIVSKLLQVISVTRKNHQMSIKVAQK